MSLNSSPMPMIFSRTIYYILFLLLVFCACNRKGEEEQAEVANIHADSLSIKLNSPELKAVNAALLKDVSNDSLYNERARIYLSLRQFPEAINDAKRAIRMDSSTARNYLTLADIYFAENSTRLSKELLETVTRKFPKDTEAMLKLAEFYYLVQRYQEGIEFVNKALRINENIAKGYYIKGSIYRESGDTSRAVSSLETAIEQDAELSNAHYDLGVIYAARRNPLAMQYYENAIRLEPARKDALYGRARFLQDLGKTDQALSEYEALLKKDPSCDKCLYNIGALQLEIKKNPEKALGYFTKAIELRADYLEAYFARGYTYSLLKDKNSARADYNMCLQIRPNYAPAVQGLNEL